MPYSPSRDTCSLFPSRFPFHFIRIDRSTFPRRHGKQTERRTDGRRTDALSLARPSRRRRHRPLRVGQGEGGGGGGMVAVQFLDNKDVGLARPLDKVGR